MRLAAILAVMIAPAATPTVDPYARMMAAAHRDFTANLKTDFPTSTVPDLTGQPFKVQYAIRSGNSTGASATGYYMYAHGVLSLTFYPSVVVRKKNSEYLHGYNGFVAKSRTADQPSYTGSNAYGVRTRVGVSRLNQDGIVYRQTSIGDRGDAAYDAPLGEFRKDIDDFSREHRILSERHYYYADLTLNAVEARKIALDTDMLIEGVFAPIEGVGPTLCSSKYIGATIDSPSEIYGSDCYAGAKITRIAFVRRSTGAVIKEWKMAG